MHESPHALPLLHTRQHVVGAERTGSTQTFGSAIELVPSTNVRTRLSMFEALSGSLSERALRRSAIAYGTQVLVARSNVSPGSQIMYRMMTMPEPPAPPNVN